MNKRILFIDDDIVLRRSLAEVLEFLGYVVTACSQDEFYQSLYLPYDIILCDHNLDHVKGGEVYRITRTFPHLAKVPFLILTVGTGKTICEYSGLTERNFMAKPFLIDDFEQRLRLLLC